MKNGDFSIAMLVYRRVSEGLKVFYLHEKLHRKKQTQNKPSYTICTWHREPLFWAVILWLK